MSQFEMPGPPEVVMRNHAPPIPRIGITESLAAPGLAPIPYHLDRGAQIADQFARAINYSGDLAVDIAQNRTKAQLAQAEADRLAATSHRGQAVADFNAARAGIENQIETGKLLVPAGVSPEEFAQEYARQSAAGAPAAYQEAYAAQAVPVITRSIYARRAALEAQAQQEDLALRAQANAVEVDPSVMLSRVEEAKKLFPNLTEMQLKEALIVPALKSAAKAGNASVYTAASEALGLTFPEEQQAAQRDLADANARKIKLTEETEKGHLYNLIDSNAPASTVIQAIDSARSEGKLDAETALRFRGMVTSKAQSRFVNDLAGKILRSELDPATVQSRVLDATKRDPDAPDYIDPDRARVLINQSLEVKQRDVAREDVVSVLTGAGGHLTPSKHGTAFDDVLRLGGFIDQAGRVAQPDALATAVVTARILPRATSETLVQNLTGSDAADAASAAQAIGAIGAASPKLLGDLLDTAGPRLEPAITAAVDAYQRGRQAPSAQTIRDLIATNEAKPDKPAPDVVADLKASKIDPAATAEKIIEDTRDKFPHAKETLLGFDALWPDPSLQGSGADVRSLTERWFTDRYTQLRDRLPREKAIEQATTYAQAKAESSIDYVRWDGAVQPVLIDRGRGLKLPDGLRWSEGFEDEARADLKAAGIDAADVAAVRPYLDPATGPGVDPTSRMGWVFVNATGDTITDHQGRALLFRPSDPLAKRAADFRALLDQKAAEFITPARRREVESTLMGTRGPDPLMSKLIKR